MLRTASIKLRTNGQQSQALSDLRAAYAEACNRLVSDVVANRCWSRVVLHHKAYYRLRRETPLGSQMVCNAIFTVSKAYQSQNELGKIKKDMPLPLVSFARASVHFDKRTYSIRGECVSLYTLAGRQRLPMIMGEHQQRLLQAGRPKEAELICRRGTWFLNVVVELDDPAPRSGAGVLGVDVGENNLAATSTGKVFGGGELRHQRDCYLSFRRRLPCNGSESAKQLLSKVSGRERRHVQPAWTSQTCSHCGALGIRLKHRFSCSVVSGRIAM